MTISVETLERGRLDFGLHGCFNSRCKCISGHCLGMLSPCRLISVSFGFGLLLAFVKETFHLDALYLYFLNYNYIFYIFYFYIIVFAIV